jgi:hypothetical protein
LFIFSKVPQHQLMAAWDTHACLPKYINSDYGDIELIFGNVAVCSLCF